MIDFDVAETRRDFWHLVTGDFKEDIQFSKLWFPLLENGGNNELYFMGLLGNGMGSGSAQQAG